MQIFKPFTPVVRASQGAQTHPLVHSFLNIFPIIFLNRIFFYRYLSTVKTDHSVVNFHNIIFSETNGCLYIDKVL
jgi:hypothetical protein